MRHFLVGTTGMAAGLGAVAAAWYGGHVEEILIARFLRAPLAANVEKQLDEAVPRPRRRPLAFDAFDTPSAVPAPARIAELDALLARASLPELQNEMDVGRLDSEELVRHLVDRIRRLDGTLNSVTELDPGALAAARDRDAERRAGRRGPLLGIPVLLKDNIATTGALHTTAGAAALATLRTGFDAPIVRHLRDAGAVVLGKASMTEWANFMARDHPNGFSVVGGQVRNPHGPFDVSGSSSGSAVAVSTGLAPLAVGTETWGSLIMPASQNGIVAIKPTAGLVPNAGIVPIIPSRDVAGPMTRSVSDAALLLEVLAGGGAPSLASELRADGLVGLRLGAVRLRAEERPGDDALLADAIEILRSAGATVVERPRGSLIELREEIADFFRIARHDFAEGVDAFLATTPAPRRSLAEIVEFNAEDPAARAPYGQDLLVDASTDATPASEITGIRARSRARARTNIDGALTGDALDLLVAIGGAPTLPYAAAGYPALHVPAGRLPSGEPTGLTFVGGAGDEPLLVRASFAFEQAFASRAEDNPTDE